MINSIARFKLCHLFVFALNVFVVTNACAQQDNAQKLKDIQTNINNKQKQVERQLSEVKRLQQVLRENELAEAETARKLNQTQIKLTNNKAEQKQLASKRVKLEKQQQQQQALLAKQLRSAFMAGNHDYVKMLLNQEDAGRFERINTYYQYLNNARKAQIDDLVELQTELTQVNAQLLDSQTELTELEQAQQLQRNRLKADQKQRQTTLAKIESSIDSEAAQIEQLQINERTLKNAIEQAQLIAQQVQEAKYKVNANPLTGLKALRGRLLRPAKGKTRNRFGKRRQGQVRWKGLLIEGSAGSRVNAVYQGVVIYADWLKGFGLVSVVDHGEGYMSLYGHNQALLKTVGDTVEAGEQIALLGQSGGQASPSLYFEIRHKGKAINPGGWFQ